MYLTPPRQFLRIAVPNVGYQQYLRYKRRNGSSNSSAQEGSRHSSCSKWSWIHLFKGMVIKLGVFSRVLWKNRVTFRQKCVKHSLTPPQGLNALLFKKYWIRHWLSLFRELRRITPLRREKYCSSSFKLFVTESSIL